MALTPTEVLLIEKHFKDYQNNLIGDELMLRYREGEQTIRHLGMAVPPSYRDFTFVLNWPGVYVESIESRQDVRALIMPGQSAADPRLVEMMDANNLDSDLSLFLDDRYTFGRSFMSVGSNEDDPQTPLVHVESPREMTARVDIRKRQMTSACKFYGVDEVTQNTPTNLTLMLPDQTVWAQKTSEGRWAEIDRDVHKLGRVPVTMSLCRRRSGSWAGRPLITRVNDLTDALARSMANMQFASEAAGIPQKYALGVSSGDFVDAQGNPLPQWAAYFNAIWANKNKDIKVGQFDAADLKNFETQVTLYGKLASSVTYLPSRYFGLTTVNPASEGAIDGEEAQFVKFVERQNSQVGSVLGWTAGLWWRFATGNWVDGSRIGVEWHNPGTPTIAQREDALMKRKSVGVLSRQGYWDELGWSEQRKAKEQQYLDEEAADPLLTSLLRPSGAPVGP